MAIKATRKREYMYQAGMKNHHWIHYPTKVVLEGEDGFLSVWQEQDPETYTAYGVIVGERLYSYVRPYDGKV